MGRSKGIHGVRTDLNGPAEGTDFSGGTEQSRVQSAGFAVDAFGTLVFVSSSTLQVNRAINSVLLKRGNEK